MPNITIGPMVVKALRPHTSKLPDVHLMISPVDGFLDAFAQAGADIMTIHPEAGPHIHRSDPAHQGDGQEGRRILNPGTPAKILDYLIDEVDLLLAASANPDSAGRVSSKASSRRLRPCAR